MPDDVVDYQLVQQHPTIWIEETFGEHLWQKEKQIANSVRDNRRTTVRSCHGSGKCLAKGTEVLMFDGTIKKVEDVQIGEQVMGDDSTPRTVLSLSHGHEPLYKIIPKKGQPFTVNKSHILSLKKCGSPATRSRGPVQNGTVTNISVDDYLKQNREFKARHVLYRTGVDFKKKPIKLDPYFFGLWLGDGNSKRPAITTEDEEIKQYIYKTAKKNGLKVQINQNKLKTCPTYVISAGKTGGPNRNPLLNELRQLGVYGNKHIPLAYKANSRKIRLQVLAGIIDTDGSRDNRCCYSVTFVSKRLANDLVYLCRSLGFAAYVHERIARIRSIGYETKAYRVSISGDCSIVPCKLPRKLCPSRRQEKNALNVGFKVESLGIGEYFGFDLDSNRLYLLGDFTVTHNSFISARIALWFLYSFPNSKVITTAPTFRQVEDILWREMRKAHSKSKIYLSGTPLKTTLNLGEDWFAMGLSTDDPDRFQGFHADYILLIVDEAAGVTEDIFQASSGIVSSDHARELYIGNPTNLAGSFYQSFKMPGFNKIHISAFDTPNFTKFNITLDDIRNDTWKEKIISELPCPYLITPEWVADKHQRWGEESPMWQSRVTGDFPDQGEDTLIPLSKIEQATTRSLEGNDDDIEQIGADIARFGSDKTEFLYRKGTKILDSREYNHTDTMATAQNLYSFAGLYPKATVNIDVVGVGAGVFDRVLQLMPTRNIVPVNVGETAYNNEQFLNLRAEMYWGLRERFIQGDIQIPYDEDLIAQLSNIKFKFTARGQIQIESKEDMKKRGMSSPDKADALMLCFGRGGPNVIYTTLDKPMIPQAPKETFDQVMSDDEKRREAEHNADMLLIKQQRGW